MNATKSAWKETRKVLPWSLSIGPYIAIILFSIVAAVIASLIAWLRQPWRIEINRNQQ